jgi:adenylyltransferase/sulfurtransferase
LKTILCIGEILSGKLFVLNAMNFQTQIISFQKNPENAKINSLIDYEKFCTSPLLSSDKKNEVKEISIDELKKLIDNKKDFQLIDVREEFEYALSNIKGENIPLGSIEKSIDKISRTKQVIIHCKSGMRSRKAIDLLRQKYGFTNLYNLIGGIDAWNKLESKQTVIP